MKYSLGHTAQPSIVLTGSLDSIKPLLIMRSACVRKCAGEVVGDGETPS
jgi:hypothetical protein